MKFSNLYIGTLSGTSADSIDAALFELGKKINLVGSASKKIPENLKSEITKLSNTQKKSQWLSNEKFNKIRRIFCFRNSEFNK